jgi:hypothetical protein
VPDARANTPWSVRARSAGGGLVGVVVVLRVCLGGFRRVMVRVMVMPGREMRVVGGFLVISGLVVLRGLAMMMRGVIVVLRGFVMVFGG